VGGWEGRLRWRLSQEQYAATGSPLVNFSGGHRILLAAIPIEQIHPNPNQPRRFMDPQALDELTESVRMRGVLQTDHRQTRTPGAS